MGTTSKRYSAEVRERAERMVAEHQGEYVARIYLDSHRSRDERGRRMYPQGLPLVVVSSEIDAWKRAMRFKERVRYSPDARYGSPVPIGAWAPIGTRTYFVPTTDLRHSNKRG